MHMRRSRLRPFVHDGRIQAAAPRLRRFTIVGHKQCVGWRDVSAEPSRNLEERVEPDAKRADGASLIDCESGPATLDPWSSGCADEGERPIKAPFAAESTVVAVGRNSNPGMYVRRGQQDQGWVGSGETIKSKSSCR
jgi:hypothetical protein